MGGGVRDARDASGHSAGGYATGSRSWYAAARASARGRRTHVRHTATRRARSAGPRPRTEAQPRRAALHARRRRSRTGAAPSSTTCRTNSSHWSLNPLSRSALSGTSCHCVAEALGGRQVGVPRPASACAARCWVTQLCSPATALPWVPSTWNSTSSSRWTRTAQEELICAIDAAVELEDRVGRVVGGRRRRAGRARPSAAGCA